MSCYGKDDFFSCALKLSDHHSKKLQDGNCVPQIVQQHFCMSELLWERYNFVFYWTVTVQKRDVFFLQKLEEIFTENGHFLHVSVPQSEIRTALACYCIQIQTSCKGASKRSWPTTISPSKRVILVYIVRINNKIKSEQQLDGLRS